MAHAKPTGSISSHRRIDQPASLAVETKTGMGESVIEPQSSPNLGGDGPDSVRMPCPFCGAINTLSSLETETESVSEWPVTNFVVRHECRECGTDW